MIYYLSIGYSAGSHAFNNPDYVPAHTQAQLIVVIMNYDENYTPMPSSPLSVLIVYEAANNESEKQAKSMMQSLSKLSQTPRGKNKVAGSLLKYSTIKKLGHAIAQNKAKVLYLCSGLNDVGAITALTKQRKVLSVASRKPYLKRGASMGIFPLNGKPKIFLNQTAYKLEGTDFSSRLLKRAKFMEN